MLLIFRLDVEESIDKFIWLSINSLTIEKFNFKLDKPTIDSFESIIILN